MPENAKLLALTADIVSAQVKGNSVVASALPGLIRSVYATLASADAPPAPAAPPQEPAVPIRKSVRREYLVCLEDGAKVKVLKRYLATRYKLTLTQYREKWGLPADYPTVAPAYADRRSALAKEIGLGRKRAAPAAMLAAEPKAAAAAPAAPAPKPVRRRQGARGTRKAAAQA